MPEVHRITSEFIEHEDRLRFTMETREGEIRIVWITQRLCQRLLPFLLSWLNPVASISEEKPALQAQHKELVQSFAQKAAQAEVPTQSPVCAAESTPSRLTHTVDIHIEPDRIILRFRGTHEDPEDLNFGMEQQGLRQWLGMLCQLYQKADWPMSAWPEWMLEANGGAAAEAAAVLH